MCFSWNKSEVDIGDTNAIWNIFISTRLIWDLLLQLLSQLEKKWGEIRWTLCHPKGIEKQPPNSILFSPIYEVIWGR